MRNLGMALLIGLAAASNVSHASDPDLEIWLLEGTDCGSCDLYQTFHHGYPQQLTGYAGADSPILVTVVQKTAIPKEIAEQFTPHDYWPHSLSVMVLDDETVLYVANISEASDVAHARFPKSIMAPATAAERERSKHSGHVYAEHFEATWNLDYFVDVALARRGPYPSLEEAMLGQTRQLEDIARNNVILWGSASTPFGNSLFISERMQHIHQALEQVAGPTLNFITLYGNGDDQQPDTSTLMDGKLQYIHAAVQPAKDAVLSPDAATMGRVFHSLQNTRDNLLVQVGHSGPTGAPLWGHLATIVPPLLELLVDRTESTLVMISGACNGGQFAAAPSCGFFAAHPEVIATGCQKTPEALRSSDDYLANYFTGVGSDEADLDGDGSTTFIEAHWHASVALEDHQIPYDSIATFVDAFWQSGADKLPAEVTFARLLQLAEDHGSGEEQWAVRNFIGHVPTATLITTTDALAINYEALQKVADMTEASSVERNARMGLEYPLVLSSLARRLIWRSRGTPSGASTVVAQCADQRIAKFLHGANAAL